MKITSLFGFFLWLLAILPAGAEDFATEEKTLLKKITLSPNSWEIRDELGDFYLRNGRPERAIQAYQAAASLNPSDVYARYQIGICHELSGNFKQARRTYEEALKWGTRELHFRLGICYLNLGEPKKAISYFEKVKALQDSGGVHYALARCRASLGAFGQAVRELRKAREMDPGFTTGKEYFASLDALLDTEARWEKRQQAKRLMWLGAAGGASLCGSLLVAMLRRKGLRLFRRAEEEEF